MNVLEGKTAIVTGAGRGIGRAIATDLASGGANVVLVSRTESELDSLAEEVRSRGGSALTIRADVSNESDVSKVVSETAAKFKTLDILINNAGIGRFSRVSEMETSDFDRIWQVNMRGTFLCTKAVLPFMRTQSSGDIINISSLAGRNAFIGGAAYCASKWALIGFARCLMLEVRDQNIRVITLCPGSVDTTFAGPAGHATKSPDAIPKPEDISSIVLHALAMPRHVMVSEIDIRPTNPKAS